MKIKTGYTGCPYITAGKEYKVIVDSRKYYNVVQIKDDTNRFLPVKVGKVSSHLGNTGTFHIVEDGKEQYQWCYRKILRRSPMQLSSYAIQSLRLYI